MKRARVVRERQEIKHFIIIIQTLNRESFEERQVRFNHLFLVFIPAYLIVSGVRILPHPTRIAQPIERIKVITN